MPRLFREILAKNDLVRLFSVGRLLHPVTIDMFSLAGGFDGFWMDQEHGGLTYEQVQMSSICARANNLDCFVRMAPTNYAQVTQNLEAGAGGVMAARIFTAQEAEEFVQWAKFAPRGSRGMNTSGWDARYTHKSMGQFATDANRDHLVAIQIETKSALEQADAIAAIDGVDVLFVGPADLSQALGILGKPADEKIFAAFGDVAKACKKHGKHWGTVPVDPAYAQRCYEMGCRMLSIGGDIVTYKRGIEVTKSAYQAFF